VATRDDVIKEMQEVSKDLQAFKQSRDIIQNRLNELEHSDPKRHEILATWPATVAIWNVFILAIVRCEGLLEDYKKYLDNLEVPDNVVTLVRRDQ
jgi:hypothetical protein